MDLKNVNFNTGKTGDYVRDGKYIDWISTLCVSKTTPSSSTDFNHWQSRVGSLPAYRVDHVLYVLAPILAEIMSMTTVQPLTIG